MCMKMVPEIGLFGRKCDIQMVYMASLITVCSHADVYSQLNIAGQ